MLELRVVAFGRSGVGKSQILNQYADIGFHAEHTPTIEELYQCEKCFQGRFVSLKLLDTQGLESYKLLRELYISGAEAFLIAYNIADPTSLKGLDQLIEQIKSNKFPSHPNAVLVGTHQDLLTKQSSQSAAQIKEMVKQGTKLAHQYKIPHILTSAKTGSNINLIFEQLVKQQLKYEPDYFDTQSMKSTSSIENWVYTPSEIAQRHENSRPSIKRSMLKLRKSVSDMRKSKSILSLRTLVSKPSHMSLSSSSHANNNKKQPTATSKKQQQLRGSKSAAVLRESDMHGTNYGDFNYNGTNKYGAADPNIYSYDNAPANTDSYDFPGYVSDRAGIDDVVADDTQPQFNHDDDPLGAIPTVAETNKGKGCLMM